MRLIAIKCGRIFVPLTFVSLFLFAFREIISLDEGIFFQIEKPAKLAYIYQINPSYHIGARFPHYPIQDIGLVYADPPEACTALNNADYADGEAVLIERGGCPFVEKCLNVQKTGAKFALITDSSAGGDDFIDMVSDESKRKADIPCAWLPGVSGRRLREYLIYEKPVLWIQIPLNYTNRSLRDTFASKPPWELW